MPTSSTTAQWKGSIGKGSGTMEVAGHTLPFNVPSRFEGSNEATNPEELIGGAHAGCFSMQLSALLTKAGHAVEEINSKAAVRVSKDDGGWTIDRIELTVRGKVDGVSESEFVEFAEKAKKTCPVSKALAGVAEITLDAALA